MNKCIILCAGGFDGLLEAPEEGDYIIAADGGYRHARNFGIAPDCILGDFDSLGFVPEGAKVFPVEKDDTDAMLAVRHGLSLGYQEFHIYGSLDGDRLDHTVANLQTLLFLAERDARGSLIGNTQIATVVKDNFLFLPEFCKGIISVFAVGGEAKGVTIEGLQYEVENATLSPTFPLGVSNHCIGKPAQISVESGTLLVIYER